MVSQHLGKALSEDQRGRWVELIVRSADEARIPTDPEFRAALTSYLEWGSRIAVENSAPGARPPEHMPVPKWWWVCGAKPGARRSALSEPEAEVLEPPADGLLGFAAHIKPLFRQTDRDSMAFAFDLWKHDEVQAHGEAILARLKAGTMPCDGAWPKSRIEAFERWLAGGAPA